MDTTTTTGTTDAVAGITCTRCSAGLYLCTERHTDDKGPRLHCLESFTHDVMLADLPEADVERLVGGADRV